MLAFTCRFGQLVRRLSPSNTRLTLKSRPSRIRIEALEDRCVPATYLVTSLADTPTEGTFRYALQQANLNHTGTASDPDLIQFDTGPGTIQVDAANGGPLFLASDEIAIIDATTVAGYAGSPLITLDGTLAGPGADGLTIRGGASTVKGLAIVDFGGNGLRLETHGGNLITANVISANGQNGVLVSAGSDANTIAGNFIGTDATGTTAMGNALDGIRVDGAHDTVIGDTNPITGFNFQQTTNVPTQPVSGWEGIRATDTPSEYLITGTSNADGIVFEGTIDGVGESHTVRFPGSQTTSVYGPDILPNGDLRLVGNYKLPDYQTAPVYSHGFVYEGSIASLADHSKFTTIDYPGASFTYVHSTMGGLAVGNGDSQTTHRENGLEFGRGHAFIYDLTSGTFTDVVFPGSLSNTVYGIWHNGGTKYTIAGSFSPDIVNNFLDQGHPIGTAYMADYDSSTGQFSHWTGFNVPFAGPDIVSHFDGISSLEAGVYTLAGVSAGLDPDSPEQGSWVIVRRNADGSFSDGVWVPVNDTGSEGGATAVTSVAGNVLTGIVIGSDTFPFQLEINIGFTLSNVISGNGGNGIGLYGADGTQIMQNFIGTDATGAVDLGNAGNGIFVTGGSDRNRIGGEATGGNNPSQDVFVRPPQGNLISGNDGYGVFINDGSEDNQLSGNFIGTDAGGSAALGNRLDGVAIVNADNNSLIGCTFQQDPFVFYNVLSGNGGNGLRITDSDNTTVQANFFGIGADNATGVGNALDGVLINGSSAGTQFGGVIPLGNVSADNGRNGVEIADTASGTVVFNTFCGLPAFVVTALGNHLDGMLITSTGQGNTIRTNVVAGNYANGIHLSGYATGVQLTEDIIGLDTAGNTAIPNGANGILIDGYAHDNAIGGFQPSVIPQNTISGNGGHGIAIVGNASDNSVFHSFLGTDVFGLEAIGNAGAGLFIGGNAQGTIVGGTGQFHKNVISGNLGGGVQLSGTSSGTQVVGNIIGADRTGLQAVPNHGNGVWIVSSGNQVGGDETGEGNAIAFNTQSGIVVDTGDGNALLGNSLYANGSAGILLVAGGNDSQPAPRLVSVSPTPGGVRVRGTLVAAANTTYTVEVFASPGGTTSDAKTFLGTIDVTTGNNGFGTFVFTSSLSGGTVITATATDPDGNTSELSAPRSIGSDAHTVFVAHLYQLLLHRSPDPVASGWVTALDGGASPASIVLGIQQSGEYLAHQVVAIYGRYLNRAPDGAGAEHWLGVLQQGGTFEQVAEGVINSAEFAALHGNTNAGYVRGLYQQVLGRSPGAAELDGWVRALDAGVSRRDVITGFLASVEYREALIRNDYAVYLGREADPAGLAAWLESGLSDRSLLAAILGSPEGFGKWS